MKHLAQLRQRVETGRFAAVLPGRACRERHHLRLGERPLPAQLAACGGLVSCLAGTDARCHLPAFRLRASARIVSDPCPALRPATGFTAAEGLEESVMPRSENFDPRPGPGMGGPHDASAGGDSEVLDALLWNLQGNASVAPPVPVWRVWGWSVCAPSSTGPRSRRKDCCSRAGSRGAVATPRLRTSGPPGGGAVFSADRVDNSAGARETAASRLPRSRSAIRYRRSLARAAGDRADWRVRGRDR